MLFSIPTKVRREVGGLVWWCRLDCWVGRGESIRWVHTHHNLIERTIEFVQRRCVLTSCTFVSFDININGAGEGLVGQEGVCMWVETAKKLGQSKRSDDEIKYHVNGTFFSKTFVTHLENLRPIPYWYKCNVRRVDLLADGLEGCRVLLPLCHVGRPDPSNGEWYVTTLFLE